MPRFAIVYGVAASLALVSALIFFFVNMNPRTTIPTQSVIQEDMVTVHLNNTPIFLEKADTIEKRRQGLSGRDQLEQNKGMLFVFDEDGRHGIWMKDMKFPIDIIWLDSEKQIVHIESNVSPNTYPRAFVPTQQARYVIELTSGSTTQHGITVGQQMKW